MHNKDHYIYIITEEIGETFEYDAHMFYGTYKIIYFFFYILLDYKISKNQKNTIFVYILRTTYILHR